MLNCFVTITYRVNFLKKNYEKKNFKAQSTEKQTSYSCLLIKFFKTNNNTNIWQQKKLMI